MIAIRFNTFTHLIIFLGILTVVSCQSNTSNESNERVSQPKESLPTSEKEAKKVILFFGNSLTAGYGVDADESFPSLIQQRIDSLSLPYRVVNAGVSGETTATGLNRLDWVLEKQKVDVFILELGANDGLRGLPPSQTQNNLNAMIEKVRSAYPKAKIILAGMMVPPSMGQVYSEKYNPIFREIADKKDVYLIPFLLENVGGVDSLNQSDGIHPNPAGAEIVSENVWEILGPILEK